MPLEGLKKRLISEGCIIDPIDPFWMIRRGPFTVIVTEKLARILERGKPAKEISLDQLESELVLLGFLAPDC